MSRSAVDIPNNSKSVLSFQIIAVSGIFAVLLVIGIANLYSAATNPIYFSSQLRHIAIGVASFILFGWLIPFRQVNAYSGFFYVLTCLMLVVVLVLGYSAGGSQRWIAIGAQRIQPSEFAKLAVVLAVAKYFYANRVVAAYRLVDLWPVLLLGLLVFGLIFKQPDFGTAGICLMIVAAQVFFVRIKVDARTIVSLGLLSISAMVIGWNFLLRPYQKLRILNLLNPNLDPSGSGYNSLQSLVAVGSGRLFGKGYLQGTQTQLQFLPARHTDFIFSVFAEEHGFWGSVLVFVLFGMLTYAALEIAREARDVFSSLVAVGLAALIFIEFVINVAMVLGLFPVVGMPLPFFSYGGSSLLTVCTALGLLVGIERQTRNADRGS